MMLNMCSAQKRAKGLCKTFPATTGVYTLIKNIVYANGES